MTKVLYQNTADNIVTCTRCKSVVQYDSIDVYHWTDSDGPGCCGAYHEFVYCPNCGRSIEVD